MSSVDYTPLDLSSVCNAGADCLPGKKSLAIGGQVFHGIPFQIGPLHGDGRTCLVRLDGTHRVVSIDVGDVIAYHLVFAHRQLASRLYEGGPLGEVVAHYAVHYANGECVAGTHSRTLRDRDGTDTLGPDAFPGSSRPP